MSALDDIMHRIRAERCGGRASTPEDERERNKVQAGLKSTILSSLIADAQRLNKLFDACRETGRKHSDEEHIMLAMLESLSGLFDSNESIDDHMQRLRDNLGISDEDEEEDDGSYDLWKMAEGR